ncbi:MAG: hypothetical protein M0009_08695 [Deltaproteobacteria bacterium]|nr:hypothetical protein [Deltaproteobacteria bacterium]
MFRKTVFSKSRRIFSVSRWCLTAALFLALAPCGTAQAKHYFVVTNGTSSDWCMVTIGFTDGSSVEKKIFKNMTGQWLDTDKCLQSITGSCQSLNGSGAKPKDLTGQNLCANASYRIQRLFTNYHYETQFVKQ